MLVVVYELVDCAVVTVVSILVVYPHRNLMHYRTLLPVLPPMCWVAFWVVLTVFVTLRHGMDRLVVVLMSQVREH